MPDKDIDKKTLIKLLKLQHLSSYLVGELRRSGTVLPFDKQIELYECDALPSGDMLIVSPNSANLKLPIGEHLPVLIKRSVIQKVQTKHDIKPTVLGNHLIQWITEHPLALDSIPHPGNIVLITEAKDNQHFPIITSLSINTVKRQVEIHEVTTVFGKDYLAHMIADYIDKGARTYVNERTSDWLRRTGRQLPERITNRLQEECNAFHQKLQDTHSKHDASHIHTPNSHITHSQQDYNEDIACKAQTLKQVANEAQMASESLTESLSEAHQHYHARDAPSKTSPSTPQQSNSTTERKLR